MPNIFAVIGAAVQNFPLIGVVVDVPLFRDPGPGAEAKKRAEDHKAAVARAQANQPPLPPFSKEVQAERDAIARMVLKNAQEPKPPPLTHIPLPPVRQVFPGAIPAQVLEPWYPPPPKVDFDDDVKKGDTEFLAFHPMLEPIPVFTDGCPPPPVCPTTAPVPEKKDCWENMVIYTMKGMGGGAVGGLAFGKGFCPLLMAPPQVAGCAVGFTIGGSVLGGIGMGLEAYKDHCKEHRWVDR